MLQAGIVGLPNVGKSTLFNALTRTHKAEAQNYPFCTIEPNVGIAEILDDRVENLAKLSKSKKAIHAAIEIVDIAGLVAGASKGEGLGNKFLANIREVDAIIHVVRCFEDSNIIHSSGKIDPIHDIETINTELLLADLQSVELQLERNTKKAKGNDKEAKENIKLLTFLQGQLDNGIPIISLKLTNEDQHRIKSFNLLTSKPVIFACNVSEFFETNGEIDYVNKVKSYVSKYEESNVCRICAQIESETSDLSISESSELLHEIGIADNGLSQLAQSTYSLLGLASFFTTGEDESRAWTFKIGMSAPQCAGIIHSDFEKGFIKAEVVNYDILMEFGSWNAAKEEGKIRLEGKDYKFKDGDVTVFRINR